MDKPSHIIIIALLVLVIVILLFHHKTSSSEKFDYGYPPVKAAHYTINPEPWDACGPGNKSCFYPHKACANINTNDCMFTGNCDEGDQCTNGRCCLSGKPCVPQPLSPPYIPFKCGEF